jgi:hypothetical protein
MKVQKLIRTSSFAPANIIIFTRLPLPNKNNRLFKALFETALTAELRRKMLSAV